ncbi:MAG: hypothetical protein K9H84_03925 [Bacteroidales bacterium]|nr:hypothetical protein [Bacteroidales bacterium]
MKHVKLFINVLSIVFLMLFSNNQILNAQTSSIKTTGDLKVFNGTYITTDDMSIDTSGSLENNGIVKVTGDITVNSAGSSSTGELVLNGSSTQTISGSEDLNVNDIIFEGAGYDVQTTVNIEGNSVFTNGVLSVDATDSIHYLSSATTSVASNSSHVDGKVSKTGSADFIFPIGDNGMVNQISIAGITGTNCFSAQYFNQAPPDNSNLDGSLNNVSANEYWTFNQTSGSSSVDATFYFNDGTVSGFTDPATTVIARYDNTSGWQDKDQTSYTGDASSGTITLDDISDFGDYTFGDVGAYLVDLTAFLEGPYNTSNGNMDKTLNTQGVIPLNQPYNTASWNYTGEESFSIIPADAVDWVLVEIRDGTDNTSVLETKAALIMQDGSIRNADNELIKYVPSGAASSLHFVIDHRNHFPVLSASATTQSGGIYTYDFSSQSDAAGKPATEVETGVYALMAGDVNADFNITAVDNTQWMSENGSTGYNYADMNMDENVTALDQIFWTNNNGKSFIMP